MQTIVVVGLGRRTPKCNRATASRVVSELPGNGEFSRARAATPRRSPFLQEQAEGGLEGARPTRRSADPASGQLRLEQRRRPSKAEEAQRNNRGQLLLLGRRQFRHLLIGAWGFRKSKKLGHLDNRSDYGGPEHMRCHRATATIGVKQTSRAW
jgi:hypothetical protein